MKNKPLLHLIIGYIIIAVLTFTAVIIAGRAYTVYLADPYKSSETKVEVSDESIIEQSNLSEEDSYLKVTFKAKQSGKTTLRVTAFNAENTKEYTSILYDVTVLPTRVIYVSGCDFGGYQYVLIGILLLAIFSFIFALKQFIMRKKHQFFSYKTVIDLALTVFFGLQSILYAGLAYACVFMPERMSGWYAYNLVGFAMSAIFILSIPILVAVAAFLSVSNLALIRHEGLVRNNLFGLLISAFMFAGSFACIYFIIKNPNSTGLTLEEMRSALLRSVVSSAFVYFECLFLATQICTQFAAHHEPKRNQDFILILGCQIRKDGTPTPLLKGRIDRALEFSKKQAEENGEQAFFIPTGGKGGDEIISEGECMKNYLLSQGVPENIIYAETESATTLENMLFSKKIADSVKPDANILFSTTKYHVFRSGILSAKAGLRADGIGAKTKWYFWPNAQMREFIGLLAYEWKVNIIFIALTVGVSVLMANISSIVNYLIH